MVKDNRIRYLASNEVDPLKWDECLARSDNGLIYGSRIYLDMMADHWNAVVIDDYRAVMPLPWRKRWLFRSYYHVPFLPQTGIYGNADPSLFKQITKTVFRKIRYGDLFLNAGNGEYAKFLSASPLVNMVVDLAPPYDTLRADYHRDLDKHLRRSVKHNLIYTAGNNIKRVVKLFRKRNGSKIASLKRSDYERFTSLCLHLMHVGKAIVRKVTDGDDKLLALALFLKDEKRVYNLMNVVLPDGRAKSAGYFLFDQLIQEFAGSGLILDFEGSQKFYKSFGAVDEPYFLYSRFAGILR
jgi:hypothetical protein